MIPALEIRLVVGFDEPELKSLEVMRLLDEIKTAIEADHDTGTESVLTLLHASCTDVFVPSRRSLWLA